MKKVLIGAAVAVLLGASGAQAQFPEKDIQGVIHFAAGGGTDGYARSIQPFAEEALGRSIIMTNRTGANGVLGMQYVLSQPADGYTVLFAAEPPGTYRVLGLSDSDFSDFEPINVSVRSMSMITVPADSPFETFQDLLDEAQARPGELLMGYLGPGSPGHVIDTMIQTATDFDVVSVPFDGDGTGMPAMLGGAVDFMPVGLGAGFDLVRAGRLRVLAVVNDEEIPQLPGVPPITDFLPELNTYLPWGAFYGAYVHKDTPDDVIEVLVEAFHEAAENPEFLELMERRGNVGVNASGDEARAFVDNWRSVTSWLLWDAGAAEVDPEELGIERP